jgi:phage terminase Nu1 subunit (DNA packaging protein)
LTENPLISPETAKVLLKADAAALIKQAKDGKPLNARQRAYLLSLTGGDASNVTHARNYEELADLLGVSSRALQEWRRMDGAPKAVNDGKGHDVTAWRAFVKARGLKGSEADSDDAEEGDELPGDAILKRRKLWADVQAKEFELAIKRREFVSMELVKEQWAACVAQAVAILRKKLEDELPPILVGMEALEIRKENGEVIDAFIEQMHAGEPSPVEEDDAPPTA